MNENINKKQTNFNENGTHNNLSEKSMMSEKEILKINEKYTVILDQDVNFKFYATRNGENWRDLTGDKLVLAMFQELQTAKEENETITDKIAEIREAIPTEWFDGQHPSALSASVGSPYECICYIKDYVNTLTQQNKQMRELIENYIEYSEKWACTKECKQKCNADCSVNKFKQALKGVE